MYTTPRHHWHQRFAALCVSAALGLVLGQASTAQAATAQSFAPYVDMTLQSKTKATSSIIASGAKSTTLAFIVSGSACQASWGGYYGLTASDEWFDAKQVISDTRASGSEPIISFGGAAGRELARTCTSVNALAAQYQSVIDTYNVRSLDFDIEGADQSDAASLALRSQAIAKVQAAGIAAGKPVTVSLTLPTLPTGLTPDGLNVLRSAITNGVDVSVVNVMAMDYYWDPQPAGKMGDYAIQAGEALKLQLAPLYPGRSDAELYRMVGITPMIGINDNPAEIFTTADATKLLNWANAKSIGRIAMWSLNRDFQCGGPTTYTSLDCSGVPQSAMQFSAIWKTFGGAPVINPTPTPTPAPTPTPTPAPVPTPTPTPGVVSAKVSIDTQWAGAWCGKVVVTNATANAQIIDKLSFSVPNGDRITSTWGGAFTSSGNDYTVVAPSWAQAVAGGTYADTGMCVAGSTAGQLNNIVVLTHPAGTAPVPTPTPAPTPTPGTATLTATVKKDSTWNGGFCRSFTIANTGTRASTNWKLRFTLPTSAKITDSWSGVASRSGNVVTVTAPSWAATVGPRTSVAAFGFCATGSGEPTSISVIESSLTTTAVAAARSGAPGRTRAQEKAAKIRQAQARTLAARTR